MTDAAEIANVFNLIPAMSDNAQILIASVAMSFFVVGGIARMSGRSWAKWTMLALLASPVVAGLVLLASIVVYGKQKPAKPVRRMEPVPTLTDYCNERA